MQYHAVSFAKLGWKVDLLGYQHPGSSVGLFESHENIRFYPIPSLPAYLQPKNRLQFLFLGPLKVLHQFLALNWALFVRKPASFLFIQNPPCIPVFFIAQCLHVLRGTKFIIDWHNFGYSILALKLGKQHTFVKLLKTYEKYMARGAYAHLTVSKRMKDVLQTWGMNPCYVCYDRPPNHFTPIKNEQKKQMSIKKIPCEYNPSSTKLLITSTSWTPDEDIYILWEALNEYDKTLDTPKLLVLITGKGPMKEEFSQYIKKHPLHKVRFCMPWLSIEDYPQVMACADLGVCLHTSSSGLDLPMKVVDLFGCGVPVIALSYPTISELVHDGENGLIVNDSKALSEKMQYLLTHANELNSLKLGALKESEYRWDDEWNKVIPPIVQGSN
ncbi:Chitobiosyldiphosphodolichol beta-mannosyltransferase [Schizosaccharomyces pombe]